MKLHYLKMAIRSLSKNKLNTAINILGLATGMAAVILISIYVQHELSYDRFNTKHERIYRIISHLGVDALSTTPICTRIDQNELTSNIPEVEQLTQIYTGGYPDIDVDGKHFRKFNALFVDTNFHQIFTLNTLQGNSANLFSHIQSTVITRSTAEKIFGTENAIGKTMKIWGKIYTVSGVIKDLPKTSHFSFDLLVPLTSHTKHLDFKYWGLEFFTYVLFKESASKEEAIKKIKELYSSSLETRFGQFGYKTGADLQKLTDIHLRSDYKTILKPKGNITSVYIQIFLAILILFIAIINFVNIMTVQFDGKAREIGMQKALGANRRELIQQFLGHSIVLSFIALIIATIIAEIFLPLFSTLMNRNLVIDYAQTPILIISLPLLAILVGILSGVYPAIFVSRHEPAAVIKGTFNKSRGTNKLTRTLVIFQFCISIILIANVIILQQQIRFMKNADLGFKPQNVLAIQNLNAEIIESYTAIKDELLKHPNIETVSCTDHMPGGGASGQGFRLVGESEKSTTSFSEYRVEPDYFKTMGITILEGREYDDSNPSDKLGILLNEKAVKSLNLKSPIGQQVWFHNKKYHIQGIVKDFNFESLHKEITPLMFSRCFRKSFILVRTSPQHFKEVISHINKTIQKFDHSYIPGFTIVEDQFLEKYRNEERAQKLTTYTSALAIILALMGLYALTLFMVIKRTKEIGVRKINGASILQISFILIGSFTRWLAIAFIFAVPISWYIMQRWLDNFAFHIKINIFPYLIAGIITLILALLTVGFQTWKAASQNPVKALRYE